MRKLYTNKGIIGISEIILPPVTEDSSFWYPGGNSINNGSYFYQEGGSFTTVGTDLFFLDKPSKLDAFPSGVIRPAGTSSLTPYGHPPVPYFRPVGVNDSAQIDFPWMGYFDGSVYMWESVRSSPPSNYHTWYYTTPDDTYDAQLYMCTSKWPDGTPGLFFVCHSWRKTDGGGNVWTVMFPAFYAPDQKEASVKFLEIVNNWAARPIPDTPISPEYPGETNQSAGGQGDFDNTSVYPGLTPNATLNNSSFVTYGLITIYTPSYAQLMGIRDYMWGKDFWQAVQKLLPGQDPQKYIISSHLIPLARSQLTTRTGVFEFGVFTKLDDFSPITKPECNYTLDQYVDISLGTFEITEYSGDFTNYSPYAQYSIYLPYIGIRNLGADIIVGKTLELLYRIDISSGSCCAYILHEGNVLFSFTGSVSTTIPLSSDYSSLAGVAGAVAIAGGAAAAVSGVATLAQGAFNARGFNNIMNDITSGVSPEGYSRLGLDKRMTTMDAVNAKNPPTPKPPRGTGAAVGGLLAKSYQVGDANIGSNMGMVNQQSAYIIRTLPNTTAPEAFRSLHGYMSNVSQKVGSFTGLTLFSDFHLEGIPALPDELDMIDSALKEGVLL